MVVFLALPSVIEIFEVLSVVLFLWFKSLKQKHRRGVVSPHVESVRKQERIARQPPVVEAHECAGQKQDCCNGQDRSAPTISKKTGCARLYHQTPAKQEQRRQRKYQPFIGTAI